MDKTKQRVAKIVAMPMSLQNKVGRAVCVCALGGLPAAVAVADAGKAAEKAGTGFGLGGAYLFGLAAGLAIFAIRYALDVRKTHLAAYGK
jgi:hypothetical protein